MCGVCPTQWLILYNHSCVPDPSFLSTSLSPLRLPECDFFGRFHARLPKFEDYHIAVLGGIYLRRNLMYEVTRMCGTPIPQHVDI